jgi:formate C-acetyltransferase
LEGFEHSAGACCYINMPRILDISIHEHAEMAADLEEIGLKFQRLDRAASFEELYQSVLSNVVKAAAQTAELIAVNGRVWPKVNPAPFFSAAMADCLVKRQDYTAGGGRYNPTGLPMVGFANVVDSLHAIKRLCFDTGKYSLRELLDAVRADWKGHEALRMEVIALPKHGDDDPELNAIAVRFSRDLYENTRLLTNERGGRFQLSYFVYLEYYHWGKRTLATPDGRKSGDPLAHGISPGRLHPIPAVTSVINSVGRIDLRQCPANAILDLQLPLGHLTPESLLALERVFARQGSATLQMNCVDTRTLRAAQANPDLHSNLTVRVCGFSARFTALSRELQDEIIQRNCYSTI